MHCMDTCHQIESADSKKSKIKQNKTRDAIMHDFDMFLFFLGEENGIFEVIIISNYTTLLFAINI